MSVEVGDKMGALHSKGQEEEEQPRGQNPRPFQLLSSDFDANAVIRSDLDLSSVAPPAEGEKPHVAFILEHIFSPEECQALMEFAEREGYKKAAVNFGDQEIVNEDYRSGFRVIVDDEEFVAKLWERIEPHVPRKLHGAEVVGPNERLRILKYHANNFFAPHSDAHYTRPYNSLEVSLLTIQMYLNEEFGGGETTFLPYGYYKSRKDYSHEHPPERLPCKPKTGMVLIFDQDLKHEGSIVTSGQKVTIRTDIMYRYGREKDVSKN